jgi:Tfp pilus assembly protein PilW
MKYYQNKQSGYTLIELLLYVGLIGILLSAITALFGVSVDARVKNQTISEVNEQGIYALDYMAQVIRNGTTVSSPVAGSTGSSLTVTVPTASISPTIFSVTSGVLQVKKGTATAVALTNSKVKVDTFNVVNVTRSGTSSIIQISLTISRLNPLNKNEYDYQRTFTTSAGVRP